MNPIPAVTTTDQTLLQRYLQGIESSFEELLERHSGLVFGTAMRITADRHAAEEVTQDVFVLLAKKARALRTHPSLAGWLHLTAHNVARRALRTRLRRNVKHSKLEPGPQSQAESSPSPSEYAHKIDESMAKISGQDREVLLLRYLEDLDYSEISQRLSITEDTARKRVSRALKRLKEKIGTSAIAPLSLGSLIIAAPGDLVASIASAIPPPAAASLISPSIIVAMQFKTKIALAALVFGILATTAILTQIENRKLSHELETLRQGTENPNPNLGFPVKASHTEKSFANERSRRIAAEKEADALREIVETFENEVVIAHGTVEQIGQRFGFLVKEAQALGALEEQGVLDEPEYRRRLIEFGELADGITVISDQLLGIEANPEEGSKMLAATYAELFDLTDATRKTPAGEIESAPRRRCRERANTAGRGRVSELRSSARIRTGR